MPDLVWGAPGEKTIETGVSRGILFVGAEVGVPWVGLQNISIEPQGGESESLYFDGVKYLELVDAEDFQATITALASPKEFGPCEGYNLLNPYSPGMYVPGTGRRKKFHLAWRTEVGNDLDGVYHGYKIHIAYNCVVTPSTRQYATIGSSVTPDARSWTIKTTPACGRFSYYVFHSLEADLSLLEASLLSGVLPTCRDLPGFVSLPDDGGPIDPDLGCPSILVDFQNYQSGELLDGPADFEDPYDVYISGQVNDGMTIVDLPASGTLTANDSDAAETGTHPVLTDDDDATYIETSNGDQGYTIGLPDLVGYVPGATFELHIRMSLTGGVSADDPDEAVDADAQVFITSDPEGDVAVGGFSDGTDDGMSFAIPMVDGTIQDFVVPLNMDAWLYTTVDDVAAALAAGAYLNVVAITNNNFDTTPVARVYEASVEMLNFTESEKFLRAVDPDVDLCQVTEQVIDPDTGDPVAAETTFTWDFCIFEAQFYDPAPGSRIGTQFEPGFANLNYDLLSSGMQVSWTDSGSSDDPEASFVPELNTWYTATVDYGFTTLRARVVKRDDVTDTPLLDYSSTGDFDPTAYLNTFAGFLGDGDNPQYEVVLDNVKTQVHCNVEDPTPGPPPEPFTSDHYWTRARLVRGAPGGFSSDEFLDMGPGHYHDIDFYNQYLATNTTSILYLVEIDGVTQTDPSWIPDNPGYELVRVQPWVEGYIVGDAQTSASLGTGYHPEPSKKPYLKGHVAGSYDLSFAPDWIAYPGQRMFCGADDQLTHFIPSGLYEGQGMNELTMEPVDGVTTHLVVNNVGMRLYWEPI